MASPAGEPIKESDVYVYGRILRREWRMIATIVAVVFFGVGFGVLLQPRVYRATGTLDLRQHTAEGVSAQAMLEPLRVTDQYLETQYNLLRSNALAERVVRSLGLARIEEFGGEAKNHKDVDPGEVPREEDVQRAIGIFTSKLTVAPITGSSLVRVSFDSNNRHLAGMVVNTLFENYVALRVGLGRNSAEAVGRQADSVRTQMIRAERRMHEYMKSKGLLLIDKGAGETEDMAAERLRQLQQQFTQAEADRMQKEATSSLLSAGNTNYLDSHVLQELNVKVADLRREYARLRSTFTDAYPKTREVKNQLTEMEAQLARERRRVAQQIQNEHAAALNRERLLREAMMQQRQIIDELGGQLAEYRVLQRDAAGLQELYRVLQEKQKVAGVSAALAAAEVNVVDRAITPQSPFKPQPGQTLPLAALIGLLLGVSVALVRNRFDPSVRSIDDVAAVATAPLLAAIPSARAQPLQPRPITLRSVRDALRALPPAIRALPPAQRMLPKSMRLAPAEPVPTAAADITWVRIDDDAPNAALLSDAFSGLRTSVLFDVIGSPHKSLLVTSVQPGDGKTTVSVNLAISLARLGQRVLMIDADIRKPSLDRAFGLTERAGLADYLVGTAEFEQSVTRNVSAGLDVIAAGSVTDTPAELLSSKRMRQLVAYGEQHYDMVIVDAPALFIHGPDARILARVTSGVVLVVRSGATPRETLARVASQVPNLTGVVLNDVDQRDFPPEYRYYGPREATAAGD